jgi:hypothetical protein
LILKEKLGNDPLPLLDPSSAPQKRRALVHERFDKRGVTV